MVTGSYHSYNFIHVLLICYNSASFAKARLLNVVSIILLWVKNVPLTIYLGFNFSRKSALLVVDFLWLSLTFCWNCFMDLIWVIVSWMQCMMIDFISEKKFFITSEIIFIYLSSVWGKDRSLAFCVLKQKHRCQHKWRQAVQWAWWFWSLSCFYVYTRKIKATFPSTSKTSSPRWQHTICENCWFQVSIDVILHSVQSQVFTDCSATWLCATSALHVSCYAS